jgi:hypothetical protein
MGSGLLGIFAVKPSTNDSDLRLSLAQVAPEEADRD